MTTRRWTEVLCTRCGGNGVIKIPGGVSVCDWCRGECYEPEQSERTAMWARDNCYTLARREIRRLTRDLVEHGGTGTTPATMAIHSWGHIVRMCEKAGAAPNGVLREDDDTKDTPETITQKMRRLVAEHGTQKAASAALGIPPQVFSEVMTGRRDISKSLARKLGFRRVLMYVPLTEPQTLVAASSEIRQEQNEEELGS